VPLALGVEFHTDTVEVKVAEAEAREVDDRHCVGVALVDWLGEEAAEGLWLREGVWLEVLAGLSVGESDSTIVGKAVVEREEVARPVAVKRGVGVEAADRVAESEGEGEEVGDRELPALGLAARVAVAAVEREGSREPVLDRVRVGVREAVAEVEVYRDAVAAPV
jgi:hypothetical protein